MPVPYPTWINHSGLPALLALQSRGSAAWLLFRTIIEIDCRFTESQRIDMSLAELGELTGLTQEQVREALLVLRKCSLIRFYDPGEDENTLIELITPLDTPLSHKSVIDKLIADPNIYIHRHCDCPQAQEMNPQDPKLQEVIDLYLGHCSMAVNAFIIDRLRNLTFQASMDDIRRAFRSAEKNEVHSLSFIERTAMKIQDKRIKNR